MALRRGTGIPGLSFSWRRALGVSQAQARLSRKIVSLRLACVN